jgi:hypothetical protein
VTAHDGAENDGRVRLYVAEPDIDVLNPTNPPKYMPSAAAGVAVIPAATAPEATRSFVFRDIPTSPR